MVSYISPFLLFSYYFRSCDKLIKNKMTFAFMLRALFIYAHLTSPVLKLHVRQGKQGLLFLNKQNSATLSFVLSYDCSVYDQDIKLTEKTRGPMCAVLDDKRYKVTDPLTES